VNALLERLLEERGLDDHDELVRMISGVRGALLGIAADYGAFD